MSRFPTALIYLVLLAISARSGAQNIGLKPLIKDDEWTFLQQSAKPGKPVVYNEIRLIAISKKKNGDTVLGFARAVTNTGQVIWQPMEPLPASVCLRDFVGRSNLDLAESCKEGLTLGQEWKSGHDDEDVSERIRFVVTGRETIIVPAGQFDAIKIQGTGKRTSPIDSPVDVTVNYWFAPDAKAMARSISEYRSADGALLITTSEELTAVSVK